LQALFERASDLDPAERAAWLDSACAGDDALRRELEQLLLASTSDDGRLERMIGSAVRRVEDIAAGIGRRIGQYRITGVLGEGGMGGVYRAARADGAFEHEVAVKLLSANRAVGEARRRFRSEQQILANLHHPNIAPSPRRRYDGRRRPLPRHGVHRRAANRRLLRRARATGRRTAAPLPRRMRCRELRAPQPRRAP
jgi:hypothetical protein